MFRYYLYNHQFAVENLCFMLEAVQYKKQFISDYDKLFKGKKVVEFENNSIGWIIKLPPGLPCSTIIEKENDYKAQIISLYEKYISNDADLCINISYDARKQFVSDMNEIIETNEQNIEIQSNFNEQKESQQHVEDKNIRTETELKMLKIFDNALLDIDSNLSSSFTRLQAYGNIDIQQDIIEVIMQQTK